MTSFLVFVERQLISRIRYYREQQAPMRKLKPELTELEVTSFETRVPAGARGTVQGHKPPAPTCIDQTCGDYTCGLQGTCDYATCPMGCYGSGGGCFTWPYTGCDDCAYNSDITCGR
jgi:hypothetical protein